MGTTIIVVLTASTDSIYSHKGWCDSHEDLKGLKYLMLSDITRKLSADYEVLDEDKGLAYRGIFLIDPQGVIASKGIINNGQHIGFVLSRARLDGSSGENDGERSGRSSVESHESHSNSHAKEMSHA